MKFLKGSKIYTFINLQNIFYDLISENEYLLLDINIINN